MSGPTESPEWAAMADREPYRIGYSMALAGHKWFVYDMRTEEKVRAFASRNAAQRYADQMNDEHRRWFR